MFASALAVKNYLQNVVKFVKVMQQMQQSLFFAEQGAYQYFI